MFLKVREKIGEQDHITYVNLSFIDEFRIATAPVLVGEDLLYKVILGFTRSDEGGIMFKTLIEAEPCKKEDIEINISKAEKIAEEILEGIEQDVNKDLNLIFCSAPTMDKLQRKRLQHNRKSCRSPTPTMDKLQPYFPIQ